MLRRMLQFFLLLRLNTSWLGDVANAQRIVAVFSTSKRTFISESSLENHSTFGSEIIPEKRLKSIEYQSETMRSKAHESSYGHRFGRKLTTRTADDEATTLGSEERALIEIRNATPLCNAAKVCKPGVVLPVWQPQIMTFETKLFRSLVYLVAMAYLFYGVSIVSDRFMAAIEVITSQEREVEVIKPNGERTIVLVSVWNETVSNLTLMALGSSAPEILLSIIEICGNNFEAGELGPSTIVGSAAFNLFVIIAICIYVVPSDEIRRIHRIDVFWITVAFSIFAYVWLYFILAVSSPNVIEVWEGVLTFLFFPLTVACAFVTNKHLPAFGRRLISQTKIPSFIRRSPKRMGAPLNQKRLGSSYRNGTILTNGAPKGDAESQLLENDAAGLVANSDRQSAFETFRRLRAENPDLTLAELEQLTAAYVARETPKSRAFYRIQATHKMTGSGSIIRKKLIKKPNQSDEVVPLSLMPAKPKRVVVGFNPVNYICMESVGILVLNVEADRGSLQVSTEVSVHYRTIAETAQEHEDFIPTEGILTYRPNETIKTIEIAIVDNDVYEEDEQFFVELFGVTAHVIGNEMQKLPAIIDADAGIATVCIVDDDHGGAFSFNSEAYRLPENSGVFELEVRRHRGACGDVTLPYCIIDGTAKNGVDFIAPENGNLIFKDGQNRAKIIIEIINDDEYEKSEEFFVEIDEPRLNGSESSSKPSPPGTPDGRPVLGAYRRCRITIVEDKEFKNFVDKLLTEANTTFLVGSSSWKNQFIDAVTYGDINGDGLISSKEKFLHYISLPWKLTFALIPPTDYYNGWLCFVVAIIAIGILTAVIGDVASMFGCTIGIEDSITAISFVALGTSLPDTFASKTAAVQDKTADASIGNVTGSNAVNVFLGIGVAWAIAAVYHAWHGSVFHVEAGSLASSVSFFIIGAAVCFTVLQVRRYNPKIGGELGGPVKGKIISASIFVGLWLLYICYSTLVAYCIVPGF